MLIMIIGYLATLIIWAIAELMFGFYEYKNNYYRDKDLLMQRETFPNSFYRMFL